LWRIKEGCGGRVRLWRIKEGCGGRVRLWRIKEGCGGRVSGCGEEGKVVGV